MTYNKSTLAFQRELGQKAVQRIREIDAELAQVYDELWQCAWSETRKQEQLLDRSRSLEQEKACKEFEIETYYKL